MADLKLTTIDGDEVTVTRKFGVVYGAATFGKHIKIVERPNATNRSDTSERRTFDIWLDESSVEALIYMLRE